MALSLGPWVLEERLARGGMAEVWRGRKASNSKAVCIKRLDPGLTQDPDFVEMFRDEARLVLQLDHENVVKTKALYDDNPGGQPQELLLIMELVDGASLARLTKALQVQGQALPTAREALTIARQLARALFHVHTKNDDDGTALQIVHRDVSPQNLLLDRTGRLVLIDFGVARAASRLTHTRAGTLKGKAAYMAPEQVRGRAVDGRVDQFAAAVVLWELLCHRPLFHGTNELRVLEQIERAEVVPPSVVVSAELAAQGVPRDVVRDLDALVMKALSFSPDERFGDMEAFADAIEHCLARLGGPADLGPLVLRGLAAIEVSGRASEQPTRTRVLETNPGALAGNGADVSAGDRPRPQRSTAPLVAGAVVVAAVVAVAVVAATGGGDANADAAVAAAPAVVEKDDDTLAVERLEKALQGAPSHPCRTELLDELLERSTLAGLVDGIGRDVETCVKIAGEAPALLASLEKKKLLQAPAQKTKKKRAKTAAQEQKRLDEMTRRARLALDAGATDAARALLEAVVSDDPARVDERRLLAEAYRRQGETALAGVELRAFLKARPMDPERPRLVRWLKRNDLPLP